MQTESKDLIFSNINQMVNVAATCSATRALGPGLRSVVWVQGCVFHCPGCIAPSWIPIQPARMVDVESLAKELLSDPAIEGITISGGEPMLQAASLARLCRLLRLDREINIICFTGFHYETLLQSPPGPGVDEFLGHLDMLVDGPYIEKLNDNKGLRGSSNQRFIKFTERLDWCDFASRPRRTEIHLLDGMVQMVGVPSLQLKEAYNQAVDQANRLGMELFHYERV